jgi:hypothetical protein
MDKKRHSAQILIRHTFMRDHDAFKTTDIEIGQIDWDRIINCEYSSDELILINVLEFLLEDSGEVFLTDLLELNDDDRQVVLLALHERFNAMPLQENL